MDDMELAKFLCTLPEKDNLADIENIQRNLNRALSTATTDGIVALYAAEIKYWIDGINEFLLSYSKPVESDTFGKWQPIETAPKDYQWIFVARFDADNKPMWARATRWEGTFWQYVTVGEGKPSHWLSMPPLTQIESKNL